MNKYVRATAKRQIMVWYRRNNWIYTCYNRNGDTGNEFRSGDYPTLAKFKAAIRRGELVKVK